MPQDSVGFQSWEVVAKELRACREQQKQTWGDLDHALIGRWLAGEVNDDERAAVEANLDEHPELRMLTEVVSDVLNIQAPALESEPRLLTFAPRSKKKPHRSRHLFALAAAACLLLGLGISLNQQPDGSRDVARGPEADTFVADNGKPGKDGSGRLMAPISTPDGDLVAMVDDALNRNDFEKAEHLTFPPRGLVRSAPNPIGGHAIAADKAEKPRRREEAALKVVNHVLAVSPPPSADFSESMSMKVSPTPPQFAKNDAGRLKPETRERILTNAANVLYPLVQQHDNKELQQQSAHALARLGTYAGPAVAPLAETLRDTNCPIQTKTLCDVFQQLGPNARCACAEDALEQKAKSGNKDAEAALRSIRMPRWVGVRDQAGLLKDAKARFALEHRIRELSKQYQIHIVAEMVPSLPAEDKQNYAACKDDRKKAGDYLNDVARKHCDKANAERSIYLFICKDPPAVAVSGRPLNQGIAVVGWSNDAARDRMQLSLHRGKLDEGLSEVVRMIEQAIAKK